MAEISIKGARRTEFGKGASRRSRRDGFIPAVIYGHGEKPQHVALPSRELGIALKTSNVLIDVVLDDHTELTLPKSVSRGMQGSALPTRRLKRVDGRSPCYPARIHSWNSPFEVVKVS